MGDVLFCARSLTEMNQWERREKYGIIHDTRAGVLHAASRGFRFQCGQREDIAQLARRRFDFLNKKRETIRVWSSKPAIVLINRFNRRRDIIFSSLRKISKFLRDAQEVRGRVFFIPDCIQTLARNGRRKHNQLLMKQYSKRTKYGFGSMKPGYLKPEQLEGHCRIISPQSNKR